MGVEPVNIVQLSQITMKWRLVKIDSIVRPRSKDIGQGFQRDDVELLSFQDDTSKNVAVKGPDNLDTGIRLDLRLPLTQCALVNVVVLDGTQWGEYLSRLE